MDRLTRMLSQATGSAELRDDQFNYVTALLKGDGTNGAQNNTFLDGSTNNFTITRNGNITQGTFSPYGANWSNYFDGTGSYIELPTGNATLNLGTGNFSIECFVFADQGSNSSNVNGYPPQLFTLGSASSTGSIEGYFQSGSFNLDVNNVSALSFSANLLLSGTWNHLYISRSGTTLSVFVNGALTTSGTNSTDISRPETSSSLIGAARQVHLGGGGNFKGFVSNFRVIKGTAIYTSAFIPPTAPLTAITNTSLLTCQSNRFIDNSANNFTITRNGDTSVERFSPFSPTVSYAAGTIGGSGYAAADGYLTTTGDCLPKGTVDCCVEFWWYPITHTVNVGWCKANLSGGIWFDYQATGNLNLVSFEVYTQGGGGVSSLFGGNAYASSGKFLPKQWNHVAYVRTGDTHSVYCNGIRLATTTNSIDWQTNTDNLILTSFTSQRFLYGYVSSFRSVVGGSPYNANNATITIPTTQLAAIANTKLLLNFTNAGVIDNAMMNDLETVGNAQISTTQSKWGGASMYFNGSGARATTPSTVNLQIGGGNWTIEGWVKGSSQVSKVLFGKRDSASAHEYFFLTDGSGNISFYFNNGSKQINSGTPLSNAWQHIAACSNNGTVTLYIDGVASGNTTGTLNSGAATFSVGASADGTDAFTGYIDDLRITKGYARYTANFTPPGPLPTR